MFCSALLFRPFWWPWPYLKFNVTTLYFPVKFLFNQLHELDRNKVLYMRPTCAGDKHVLIDSAKAFWHGLFLGLFEVRRFKLYMVIVGVRLYIFVSVLATLIYFQGHSGIGMIKLCRGESKLYPPILIVSHLSICFPSSFFFFFTLFIDYFSLFFLTLSFF